MSSVKSLSLHLTSPGETGEPAGSKSQLSSSSKMPCIQAKNKGALLTFFFKLALCSVLQEEQREGISHKQVQSQLSDPQSANKAHLPTSPLHKSVLLPSKAPALPRVIPAGWFGSS